MTYHNESNIHAGYFQAAARGQEFVISEQKTNIVEKHIKQLIKRAYSKPQNRKVDL